MKYLIINQPGFLTTVQDSGRFGYRSSGMPVSGAMDMYSCTVANLLTGNRPDDAVLEMTLTGPEIIFPGKMLIAVTGADMTPMVNGHPVRMWRSLKVTGGDRLTFGSLLSGARSYLAVSGGIDVPLVMGSRSTYLRGKIGGFMGRKLMAGDRVPVSPGITLFKKEQVLPLSLIPEWRSELTISIMPGVDFDQFTGGAAETLFKSEYKVTNNSDRMGIRLSGEPLMHTGKADVISYPLTKGTIQVPGDGQPVIMLSDSQTVGGYTQIANIIGADLYKTGQLKPGDSVRFKIVSYEKAIATSKDQLGELSNIFGKTMTGWRI
jgi:antagonist of KipI